MRLVLAMLIALVGPASASDDKMVLRLGAGVDTGDEAGYTVRFENVQATERPSGFVVGAASGYEYWSAGASSGFHIPIGGFVGTHVGGVTSTFGAGVGLLAIEEVRDDTGFGVVPYASATLGFDLSRRRSVTIDARASRHVLLGAPDIWRWNIAVMWGTSVGH